MNFILLFAIVLLVTLVFVSADNEDRDYIRFCREVGGSGGVRNIQFGDTDRSTCNNNWQVTKVISNAIKTSKVKFYINKCKGELVVAFPGTNDFVDAVADLATWRTDCKIASGCGSIHKGFWEYYEDLRDGTLAELRLASIQSGVYSGIASVVFTGHSQGAAMATIAAYEAQVKNNNGELTFKSIKLVTVGSPRVGSSEFCNKVNSSGLTAIRRYVTQYKKKLFGYGKDIVTVIPPDLFGFAHTKGEVSIDCPKKSEVDCHFLEVSYMPYFDPFISATLQALQ
jgi:hypothetical protein